VRSASANPIYSFTTISFPGAFSTSSYGINNSGQIVGSYFGAFSAPPPVFVMYLPPGFLYTGGTFTTLDVPGEPRETIDLPMSQVG
jgi:hypothetical protein